MNIGVIGCGFIADTYLEVMQRFPMLHVSACADLDRPRAEAKAAKYGLTALSVDELLADPEIELVVNLTIPAAHAEVDLAVLAAGKHMYGEKPLALSRADGRRILDVAAARGLRVGSAPDTFLGGGLQTCRRLIDEGAIGTPVAATANLICRGHEHWHPNPDFYYQPGGGPMFDMGPYYLTALVSLLGPVGRVSGSARASFPTRTVTSKPNNGRLIEVQTPTHVAGVLDFSAGPIATMVTTFDVYSSTLPKLEIYGTAGGLRLPDPNNFGGAVYVQRGRSETWEEVPLSHGYIENMRGLGVADMAAAIAAGRPHRANGELAYHVLDVMCAVLESSESGRHVAIESSCRRPAALPAELPFGVLDG